MAMAMAYYLCVDICVYGYADAWIRVLSAGKIIYGVLSVCSTILTMPLARHSNSVRITIYFCVEWGHCNWSDTEVQFKIHSCLFHILFDSTDQTTGCAQTPHLCTFLYVDSERICNNSIHFIYQSIRVFWFQCELLLNTHYLWARKQKQQ